MFKQEPEFQSAFKTYTAIRGMSMRDDGKVETISPRALREE